LLLCLLPLHLITVRAVAPRLEHYAARTRQDFEDISSRLQETVARIHELQLNRAAEREAGRLCALSDRFRVNNIYSGLWRSVAGCGLLLLGAEGPLLMAASAAAMLLFGEFRFEQYVQFGLLMGMLHGPVTRLFELHTN